MANIAYHIFIQQENVYLLINKGIAISNSYRWMPAKNSIAYVLLLVYKHHQSL